MDSFFEGFTFPVPATQLVARALDPAWREQSWAVEQEIEILNEDELRALDDYFDNLLTGLFRAFGDELVCGTTANGIWMVAEHQFTDHINAVVKEKMG